MTNTGTYSTAQASGASNGNDIPGLIESTTGKVTLPVSPPINATTLTPNAVPGPLLIKVVP